MKSDEVQCVPEIGPPLGFFLGRAGLDPKKDLRFTLAFLLPLTLQVSLEQAIQGGQVRGKGRASNGPVLSTPNDLLHEAAQGEHRNNLVGGRVHREGI